MNVLSFEKRDRPPAPEWRPEDSIPTYFEILIDGVPISEHLVQAGIRNGFTPEATEQGPQFVFPAYVDGVSVENVGFFNHICPAGWGRAEWQREWVAWLQCESAAPFEHGRVPVLVCGYCSACTATVVEVECVGGRVTWRHFQESTGDGERLVLPKLYEGLEFTFDRDAYDAALGVVLDDARTRG